MTDILSRAVKESVVIVIVVVVVAMVVNFTRDEGIPLIADAEAFRIQTDAEFMVAGDARANFEAGDALFLDAREPRFFTRSAMSLMSNPHFRGPFPPPSPLLSPSGSGPASSRRPPAMHAHPPARRRRL